MLVSPVYCPLILAVLLLYETLGREGLVGTLGDQGLVGDVVGLRTVRQNLTNEALS